MLQIASRLARQLARAAAIDRFHQMFGRGVALEIRNGEDDIAFPHLPGRHAELDLVGRAAAEFMGAVQCREGTAPEYIGAEAQTKVTLSRQQGMFDKGGQRDGETPLRHQIADAQHRRLIGFEDAIESLYLGPVIDLDTELQRVFDAEEFLEMVEQQPFDIVRFHGCRQCAAAEFETVADPEDRARRIDRRHQAQSLAIAAGQFAAGADRGIDPVPGGILGQGGARRDILALVAGPDQFKARQSGLGGGMGRFVAMHQNPPCTDLAEEAPHPRPVAGYLHAGPVLRGAGRAVLPRQLLRLFARKKIIQQCQHRSTRR